MTRLNKASRDILHRIAAGWRPLRSQIADDNLLARRGMLRLDWGAQNDLVWYITDAGQRVIDESNPRKTGKP